MSIALRRVRPAELGAVVALNNAAVPMVTDTTLDQIEWFAEIAPYFTAAVDDDRVVGFLIGLTPAIAYGSPNFRYFQRRYDAFVYIDRVAVDARVRGRGIGRALYADLEAFARARAHAPRVTCEVHLKPPNEGSLAFHARLGFQQVGTQEVDGGARSVALLVKTLVTSPAG